MASNVVPIPKATHLIGSELVSDGSGESATHVNPATGETRPLPLAGLGEIDAAVAAARQALQGWRAFPPAERRAVLLRIADLLRERSDLLEPLATYENGTPSVYRNHVAVAGPAAWFEHYAGWVDKLNGEVIDTGQFTYTMLEPYGVIAAFVPWNGPLYEIGMKCAPALAAGNTVILKAPELAPFTAVAFGELCLEAGLPPGVFNVVVAGPEGSAALVAHPGVDKVSFTGSGPTARRVMAGAATQLTPSVMELGGKSACLVFEDGDINLAAGIATQLALAYMTGQVCTAPSRIIALGPVYDAIVDATSGIAKSLPVGDPTRPDVLVGPVIDRVACDRVLGVIATAQEKDSGRLVAGGSRLSGELDRGFFIEPTVFADVDNASDLAQNEIFGPVLSVIRAEDEEQALALANDSLYGLASYVFTRDLNRAHRAARRLETGIVCVNGVSGALPTAPFGGKKGSGFGREGGRAGIDEFLSIKTVSCDLGT